MSKDDDWLRKLEAKRGAVRNRTVQSLPGKFVIFSHTSCCIFQLVPSPPVLATAHVPFFITVSSPGPAPVQPLLLGSPPIYTSFSSFGGTPQLTTPPHTPLQTYAFSFPILHHRSWGQQMKEALCWLEKRRRYLYTYILGRKRGWGSRRLNTILTQWWCSAIFLCVSVVYAFEWVVLAVRTARLLLSWKFPTFALKWLLEFWGYILKTHHRGVE